MLHGIDPVFAVSGLAVGLLVGITGVGGGSLMTPLLVLAFGVHPATAVGTDLLYAGITKISGGAVHAYHGSVDWRITRRLAYGSVPAALFSLLLLAHLGSSSKASGGIISTTLGIALIMTAVTLIFRKALLARLARVMDGASEQTVSVLTVVLGAVLGVLVTISSVGRRHRRHSSADALSQFSDCTHCRLRYRACGAADADRRRRTLVAWIGRLPYASFTARGLDPGHYDFQPFRLSRPRPSPAPHPGRHPCSRRRTSRILNASGRPSSRSSRLNFSPAPRHSARRDH